MDWLQQITALIAYVVDLFVHLDVHLNELVHAVGPWLYVVLFLVIFAETGLVVMPILPGDSLLFAVGALAALPDSAIDLTGVTVLLAVAAILGDGVNYAVGYHLGPRVFRAEGQRFLNPEHLHRAKVFYEKHGGKTIILARFMPIIRTFAPFVAGIGRMSYTRFAIYNAIGALLWVPPFLLGGYFLGNLPQVKTNFHYIVVAILVLSVAPALWEYLKTARSSSESKSKV